MRIRTILAIIVSIALTAFFVLNWRVFAAPAKLSLLVTSVDTTVGVVMLALFALILVVLSSFVGIWHSTLLLEFRRQGKELHAQRTLAESAEASRFTELATLIRDEIANSNKRFEAALETLRSELHETENSITATLGEMDDRYKRAADRTA